MLNPLRLARMRRGLRQIDLAIRVGISPARISYYETGILEPTPEVIKKIADVLNCTEAELHIQKTERNNHD